MSTKIETDTNTTHKRTWHVLVGAICLEITELLSHRVLIAADGPAVAKTLHRCRNNLFIHHKYSKVDD